MGPPVERAPLTHGAADRLRDALPAAFGLALFALALLVLRRQLHAVSLARNRSRRPVDTDARPAPRAGVDRRQLRRADRLRLPGVRLRRQAPASARIVLASFLAYAIANNVGFAMLSGASVRYRFYTRWGITADELSRIVFSTRRHSGWGCCCSAASASRSAPLPADLGVPRRRWRFGRHRCSRSCRWRISCHSRAARCRSAIRGFDLPLPPPRLPSRSSSCRSLDWVLAGAVLYVLLPLERSAAFWRLLGAFLVAQLLGLASHVPGGVGVFEGTDGAAPAAVSDSGALLPALIVYRAVYYLLPLRRARRCSSPTSCAAASASRAHERGLGRLTEQLTPRAARLLHVPRRRRAAVLGCDAGRGGPARAARSRAAARRHRGLAFPRQHRGRRAAAALAGSGAAARCGVLPDGGRDRRSGIVASLLKGVDYEEATILAVVLLVLWRARPAFDRRAAFFDTRFSPGWIVAIVGAIGASIWLGLFAFKHVDYSNELWWQFELHGEASRSCGRRLARRLVLLLFAVARLIGHAPHEASSRPTRTSRRGAPSSRRRPSTSPYLVYLRDKALLFNEERTGFVMYGVQGRTWVALGRSGRSARAIGRTHPPVPRTLRRFRRHAGVLRDVEGSAAPLRRFRARRSSSWAKKRGSISRRSRSKAARRPGSARRFGHLEKHGADVPRRRPRGGARRS